MRNLNGRLNVFLATTVLQALKSRLSVQSDLTAHQASLSISLVLMDFFVTQQGLLSMQIVHSGTSVMDSALQAVLLDLALLATQSARLMKQHVSFVKEVNTQQWLDQSDVSLALLDIYATVELTPILLQICSFTLESSVLLGIIVPKAHGRNSLVRLVLTTLSGLHLVWNNVYPVLTIPTLMSRQLRSAILVGRTR